LATIGMPPYMDLRISATTKAALVAIITAVCWNFLSWLFI
jgi:hypothetical protein